MRFELLRLNEKTARGYIWGYDSVLKAINSNSLNKKITDRQFFGSIGYSIKDSVSDAAFIVTNLLIENDILYCDIEILDTPDGRILTTFIELNAVVFKLRMTGRINCSIIEECSVNGIYAEPKNGIEVIKEEVNDESRKSV